MGGVPAAVADQVAYDIALIALCRHAGVGFDVEEFNQPDEARGRLEEALAERGLLAPGANVGTRDT